MAETENIWLLENVRIASPCPMSWDEMQGDNARRHCEKCSHTVYNFSGMTREEAETILRENEGRVCARLYRREDGAVMTSDCPKTAEVPVPQGFFARWKHQRKRKLHEKTARHSFPGAPMPDDFPHLTGIVARPEPWMDSADAANADADTSSTQSSDESGEGTEKP